MKLPRGAIPVIETERLRLRPFCLADAAAVQRQVGDYEVARKTANIPHPYEDGMAESWISGHAGAFERGEQVTWAVVERGEGALVGAISLTLSRQHDSGELGYWIGRAHWGRGYGTEAARAAMGYGFDTLQLHRLHARHIATNPASGRIMQKLGMRHEGTLIEADWRWGEWNDLCLYALLRREYAANDRAASTRSGASV